MSLYTREFTDEVMKDKKIAEVISENIHFSSYYNLYNMKATSIFSELAEREAGRPPRRRRNIKDLKPEDEEVSTLKKALEIAVNSGEYQKFVTYHSQFMWEIHGFRQNNQRFLPWHRVYLLKFEEMLNTVMKKETMKDHNIAIPYWDWEHDRGIPWILEGLTPTMDLLVYLWNDDATPAGSRIFHLTVKRFPGTFPDVDLPTEQIVNVARNFIRFRDFSNRRNGLEGVHGGPHVWVGGINPNPDPTDPFDSNGAMYHPEISPLDFCFWLHHANIDRIWAVWQKKQEEAGNTANIYPDLNENATKMTPWYPEYTEPQTRNIEALGYVYE